MKKIKDYSDEDDYEVDDPDYPEVEGASEEEWTPEPGTEVNRHADSFPSRHARARGRSAALPSRCWRRSRDKRHLSEGEKERERERDELGQLSRRRCSRPRRRTSRRDLDAPTARTVRRVPRGPLLGEWNARAR